MHPGDALEAGSRLSIGRESCDDAVLVVDDDALSLRALSRCLRGLPCVQAFETGRAAVNRVRQGGVTVVLCDIRMPGMSGIELLRELHWVDPDLPVVLVTGSPTIATAQLAIEHGAFRYLPKPCEASLVTATVALAKQAYRSSRSRRLALERLGRTIASDRVGFRPTFDSAVESLWMAFQPIVSASGRSVFGYEALLRGPDGALSDATALLQAAERLGAIEALGRQARRRAAEQFLSAPGEPLLFVNLHPKDLGDPDLLDPGSALAKMAHRVVLEITEHASLDAPAELKARIAALRALGFRIAIDDLGSGYSGLSNVALLEPDIVKVDMTLTRDIEHSPVKQKLVSSLVGMCRDMGMACVIEGVETDAERHTLTGLGCDLLQGFFFARPERDFPTPSF